MTIEALLTSLTHYVDSLIAWGLPVVIIGSVILGGISGFMVWSKRRWLQRQPVVWLEVTPPSSVDKTPEATKQLFTVIHGMREARSLKDRLLRRIPSMSFEIISTRSGGIRYLIRVGQEQAGLLEKTIASYIPEAKVNTLSDPATIPDATTTTSSMYVIEFKATGHYILPLTLSSSGDRHDPLSYVTGAMTKLIDDESITLQLIVHPVAPSEVPRLARRMLSNEDILSSIGAGHAARTSRALGSAASGAMLGLTALASEVSSGLMPGYRAAAGSGSSASSSASSSSFRQQVLSRQRPARTLSTFELKLMESMHQKITQPLFQVNIRVCISGRNAKEHSRALRSVLDGYSVPSYQSLRAQSQFSLLQRRRAKLARLRLPSLSQRSGLILAASELASLYHFPPERLGRTDNLIASLSKTLPAPVSLKSGRELAVILGENQHHGIATPIGLSEAERERHVFIIGGTGNGKTTMLQYAIVQDIRAGRGVAVIDPHGDLAETLLRCIPEERIDDVIYINPDDLSYPIGINLLELPKDVTGDDLLREKDIITESVISVLRKLFSEDESSGHRIEYVLRNAIQTALTLESPTLFTIYDLLNDAKFRRRVVNNLEDDNLRNFWKNEIGKAGDMQRVKMTTGITAKIGRFLFSASAKRMLEQEQSTIDFDRIIDEGKILICNVSKGLLGEDTSALFGTTILAKLQLASLRRARMNAAERRPFYLYVDEFQNFATTSFTQMLSEARKYKLLLTMAEQSTSQQNEQRLVDVILANVGTVICFRSGSPADERFVLPLFSPYVEQGEIANLPAYSFYARIAAVHSQEPMSGSTILIDDPGSHEMVNRVIDFSRKTYAKKSEVAVVRRPEPTDAAVVSVVRRKAQRDLSVRAQRQTTDERKAVS
jgi:DNA helicase HerA-like ATPase